MLTPILSQASVELVDVTYEKGPGGFVLGITLDKQGGITLDDCEHWSHKIEGLLDKEGFLSQHYSLEVSSPGLYRPLKRAGDYERFKGQRVSVRLYAAQNGQKNFHGTLLGIRGEKIVISDENSLEREFPIDQVSKANLDPVVEI